MNIAVLMPGITSLEYHVVKGEGVNPVCSGAVRPYRGDERSALSQIFGAAGAALNAHGFFSPDLLALRCPFGGELFAGPVMAGKSALGRLRKISGMAPVHIPPLVALLEALGAHWPYLPCAIVFESSFFKGLPAREKTYALGGDVSGDGLRRFGYHGLFHDAACRAASRQHSPLAERRNLRMLSICLEPRPEIAAVAGGRPLMTTGGLTPLEGLPGHRTCGELDPSIVIMLHERKKWGPERINHLLTEESGLRGLTSKDVSFEGLFNGAGHAGVRRLVAYRMLLAAGAGMAALGGLDVLVYSGRYARLGQKLGPVLARKLAGAGGGGREPCPVYVYSKPLARIIADAAAITARSGRASRQYACPGARQFFAKPLPVT